MEDPVSAANIVATSPVMDVPVCAWAGVWVGVCVGVCEGGRYTFSPKDIYPHWLVWLVLT